MSVGNANTTANRKSTSAVIPQLSEASTPIPTYEVYEVSPAVSSPGQKRRGRWAWQLAAAGVVAFLIVLAYAETVWLHTSIPQDRVSRVTLVALPAANRDGAERPGESIDHETLERLIASATDPALLDEIGAKLDARDAATGELTSVAQLGVSMRAGGQCIRVRTADGRTVTGALLYNAVRGPDITTTEAVAQEWSRLYRERSAAQLSEITLQPAHTLEVPYEICR